MKVVGTVGVWWGQHRWGGEDVLQLIKSCLTGGSPFPSNVLLKKLGEGFGNAAVALHKFTVVPREA